MPILPSTAPIPKVLTNALVLRDLDLRTEQKRNVLVCTVTDHTLLVDQCQHTFSLPILEEERCEFNDLSKIFIA